MTVINNSEEKSTFEDLLYKFDLLVSIDRANIQFKNGQFYTMDEVREIVDGWFRQRNTDK